LSGLGRCVVFVRTVSHIQVRNRGINRALVGSVLGSGLTLLLLVGGPQEIQTAVAIGGNGWPVAILLSGGFGYVAGFLGSKHRPRRWLAVWALGWAMGVLLVVAFVAVFGSAGD
jgi:hypothetical protein